MRHSKQKYAPNLPHLFGGEMQVPGNTEREILANKIQASGIRSGSTVQQLMYKCLVPLSHLYEAGSCSKGHTGDTDLP